jgi:hypothetical protein
MTIDGLVREAFVGSGDSSRSRRAGELLVTQSGLVAFAAALALLGAFVRQAHRHAEHRAARRRWQYALGVPALAYVGAAVVGPWGFWGSALVAFALAVRLALPAPPIPSPAG